MLNKNKCDAELGMKVNQFLIEKGVQTPMASNASLEYSDSDTLAHIESHFHSIWTLLGMDMSDDSLVDTPKRMAKMWLYEYTWGLNWINFPKCTVIDNKMQYDEMVLEKNISVMSNCEHHGVVIDGIANVAYIPNKKVLGLSKLNRIVEYFSRRPQVQERLTEQVYWALVYILETENVAVNIVARHYCVISRGIEDKNSSTSTSKLGGVFQSEPQARKEFFDLINN